MSSPEMSSLYQPLRQDTVEIRLLEMLPNLPHAAYGLRHVLLDEAPPFCAISYAWGVPEKTHYVTVNGIPIPITKDLAEILSDRQALFESFGNVDRHPLSCSFLWVDAICINQSDSTERAQQVRHMGKIYRTGLLAVCLEHNDWELDRAAAHHIFHLHQPAEKEDIAENMLIPAMYTFFTKGWFRRMWTVQEFVLSPFVEACMWMSYRALPLTDLYRCALGLFDLDLPQYTHSQKMSFREGIKQYLMLMDVKIEFANGANPLIIVALLWIFRDRLASNPRDKIYSLLSLLDHSLEKEEEHLSVAAKKPDIRRLLIDYTASVEDVYASVVDAVVSGTGSLNIICASQAPNVFSRSWIPNWADPWRQHSFLTTNMYATFMHNKYRDRELYQAAASTTATISFGDNMKSIRVEGIMWDRIYHSINPPPFPPRLGEGYLEWSNSAFETLETTLRDQLINTYGKSVDACDEYTAAATKFTMAGMGGLFSPCDIRDLDYRDFYQNASPEWHDCARMHRSGKKVGSEETGRGDTGDFDIRAHQVSYRRKIIISERGFCGLVPDNVEMKDTLWVLFGCDIPVLLRDLGSDKYKFIGEAYVEGLMHGEAIKAFENKEISSTSIELV